MILNGVSVTIYNNNGIDVCDKYFNQMLVKGANDLVSTSTL